MEELYIKKAEEQEKEKRVEVDRYYTEMLRLAVVLLDLVSIALSSSYSSNK